MFLRLSSLSTKAMQSVGQDFQPITCIYIIQAIKRMLLCQLKYIVHAWLLGIVIDIYIYSPMLEVDLYQKAISITEGNCPGSYM